MGERGRRAHNLLRECADLALQLFHPVTGELCPVAFRVTEWPRAHVGNPHVGLAPVPVERSQDRVVGPLAPNEPFRRIGMARALHPNDPETGSRKKDHLARLRVVLAPDVLNLDLPAQVSRFGS